MINYNYIFNHFPMRRKFMLQITESAKEKLHDSLTRTDTFKEEGKCFRFLSEDDNSVKLSITAPKSSDWMFSHEGDVILAVPGQLQPFFENKSLDINDDGKLFVNFV